MSMGPLAYIGPGGGVTLGALVVIFIGGIVLLAFGFIIGCVSSVFCAAKARANGA